MSLSFLFAGMAICFAIGITVGLIGVLVAKLFFDIDFIEISIGQMDGELDRKTNERFGELLGEEDDDGDF